MLDAQHLDKAQQAIGHVFADPNLLEQALRHSSTAGGGATTLDAPARTNNNERLEFLGDAVLGLVVCDMLYRRFPLLREGDMTKIKSLVVSREICAQIAFALGLDKLLLVGKGMQTAGSLPPSLAACAVESIIGAIYLDGGYAAAAKFITPLVEPHVLNAAASGHQRNFKSLLQQHAQQRLGATPHYRILDEQGPDHAKCFKIAVEIAGKRYEACWGATKKRAEQDAALAALRELGVLADDGSEGASAE